MVVCKGGGGRGGGGKACPWSARHMCTLQCCAVHCRVLFSGLHTRTKLLGFQICGKPQLPEEDEVCHKSRSPTAGSWADTHTRSIAQPYPNNLTPGWQLQLFMREAPATLCQSASLNIPKSGPPGRHQVSTPQNQFPPGRHQIS